MSFLKPLHPQHMSLLTGKKRMYCLCNAFIKRRGPCLTSSASINKQYSGKCSKRGPGVRIRRGPMSSSAHLEDRFICNPAKHTKANYHTFSYIHILRQHPAKWSLCCFNTVMH